MAGLDCEILGDRGTDVVRGRARRADTICENDRLVGIISIGDVVKQRIEEVEREAMEMREYIAAG